MKQFSWLSLGIAAVLTLAYGAVTGTILYRAGRLEPRISLRGAVLADRLAGILLTAIAVILLANCCTDLRGGRDAHRVTFPSRGQLLVPGCAECASSAAKARRPCRPGPGA